MRIRCLACSLLAAAVNAPDVRKKLRDLNVEARASSPEQAAERLTSEIRRWGDVIIRTKIPTSKRAPSQPGP